ncbi:MAG: hypothetical protein B6229_03890 [Spirochaetaceae bacterium 4572_7]|nr:MAG: hypothetical protein B6229_03890 [Spirochaetaceae bacterium 4572_7]
MNRFAYSQLLQWKNAGNSNLLILGGVSSVGKTSLVKQFSMMEFNRDIWIDCIDGNLEGTDNNFDIERLTIFDNINGNREVLKTLSDLANSNPDSFFEFKCKLYCSLSP